MKKLIFILSLLFISCSSPAQHEQKYKVYWRLGVLSNDPLDSLSFKIIQAIGNNRIQSYDSNERIISKDEILKNITKQIIRPLTKEEIRIALENGDFSVLELINTKYTEGDLYKMFSEKKDYMKLFKNMKLKDLDPFAVNSYTVEIREELVLDTTIRNQRGTIKYIGLIIPSHYNDSKKSKFLCMVKYEDFKKLNLTSEQNTIDQHKFVVTTWDGDITVFNENEIYKLSETITIGKMPDRKVLDKSIFRYFKSSIKLRDPKNFRLYDY